MISSIAWVPAGIANPNPKKYELSKAEKELLSLMDKHGDPKTVEAKLLEQAKEAEEKTVASSLPKIQNTLPADLRMDDYSSDEDEDARGRALGRLLIGAPADHLEEKMEEAMDKQDKEREEREDDMEEDDDDDDNDDLIDVPDTREYDPVDVEGLEAMGIARGSGGAGLLDEEEEDAEDEADVKLTSDDAMFVVAKTEEVSVDHWYSVGDEHGPGPTKALTRSFTDISTGLCKP